MHKSKFCPEKNLLSYMSDLFPLILCHNKNAQIILTDTENFQLLQRLQK